MRGRSRFIEAGAMNADSVFVATTAFWILVLLTVFLSPRYGVISYILLAQFDMSGTGYYSIGSLGIENALKAVVVPTILLYRVWPVERFPASTKKLRTYWLLLTAYAAVATLWSPYRLSAVKMLGYMYAYSVLFLVFTCAWRRGWINTRTLTFTTWLCLFFAVVQTYFLGNVHGNPEYEFRFTTFSGAATFGPFLLSLFILLLFREDWNFPLIAASVAASIGLILTGGRSIFVGFLWTLLLGSIVVSARSRRKINLKLIAKRIAFGLAAVACVAVLVQDVLPHNRLNELLSATESRDSTLEDVGTLAWRLVVYQKTAEELLNRSLSKLLVGTGTSSGATLVLDAGIFQEDVIDPNRSLHDEFLRSIYEWGLPGFLLLLLFLVEIVKIGLKMALQNDSKAGWAFLAICVPLMFSLTVENILSDGASPGGVGYNLVLTYMIAACPIITMKKNSHVLKQNPMAVPRPHGSVDALSG
jgi:O-antigen ligase